VEKIHGGYRLPHHPLHFSIIINLSAFNVDIDAMLVLFYFFLAKLRGFCLLNRFEVQGRPGFLGLMALV
jgi:hypothetical protein